MLSAEDILHAHLKLAAFPLPGFLRHVFQPSDDRHTVPCSVAVVNKALAGVFRRIVGQGGAGYRTAHDGLVAAKGDGATALFQLAHLDDDAIVERQGVGIFLRRLAGDAMHPVAIDDVLWHESDEPVARSIVAPVGIGNARGQILCIVDVRKGPCIRLCHIDHPRVGRDRLEDEREIHLAVGRDGVGLGQGDDRRPFHSVILAVGAQRGGGGEGNGISRLMLWHFQVEEHLGAVIVDGDFGDADDGHVDVARHDLVPHFRLCLRHHCHKEEQQGDDGLPVCHNCIDVSLLIGVAGVLELQEFRQWSWYYIDGVIVPWYHIVGVYGS